MSQQSITLCPFCSSDNIKIWSSICDFKISEQVFDIYDCSQCSLRFTGNPPAEEESGKYYDSPSYISHSDDTKGIINSTYHYVRKIMLNRKKQLIQKYSSHKDILDIGSGTGYFLNFMKSSGYNTLGIEINEGARNFSRKQFGLNVLEPKELISENLPQKFSIATMWHVLEHIYNPKLFLKHINASVSDQGIIVIAVPNYKSNDARHYKKYWAGYDVPRHLWHFDEKTISDLLLSSGFELIGKHRLPFDAFYVSLLSESYQKSRFYIIKGMFFGFKSWIASQFNINNTSSLVYVFRKK